jgi:hypothetical protein
MGWGSSSVVQHLPSIWEEALGSSPVSGGRKKRKRQIEKKKKSLKK